MSKEFRRTGEFDPRGDQRRRSFGILNFAIPSAQGGRNCKIKPKNIKAVMSILFAVFFILFGTIGTSLKFPFGKVDISQEAQAASPNTWVGFTFNPYAGTNNDHQIFLNDFATLVGDLKSRGINTIVFDMNYWSYHFTSTDRLNNYNYSYSHPAGGFTAQEANQMAVIARQNNMRIVVAHQIFTHEAGNTFREVYPEYMLAGNPWQQNVKYIGHEGDKPDYVQYNGNTYRCIKDHTSSLSNAPGTVGGKEFWSDPAPSDTRDPFNKDGEAVVFKMVDELINTFTVNGVKPDGFSIESDELGHFYNDPQNAPGNTAHLNAAQIFAMVISNAYNHIKANNPNMEVIMWGDMLDPYWNGGSKTLYPTFSETAGAADLISKNIIIGDWRYDENEPAPTRFNNTKKVYPSVGEFIDKGFRVWPVGWKDVQANTDLIWTENIEQARTGKVMGHMYSTWLTKTVPELHLNFQNPSYHTADPDYWQDYRGVADSISQTTSLVGLEQCRGTEYYCGIYPSCQDCSAKDGYYGSEFRDYYCNSNVVSYKVINFPNDYLSYWKFNGNANDEKNLANGTLQNGANIVTDAKRGQVANFDGVDDYVSTNSPSSLRINHLGNKLTFSSWVYWKGSQSGSSRIGGFQGWAGDYALFLQNDGRILLEVDGRNDNASVSNNSITANAWNHIVGTFDSDYMKIYIDGKLDKQTAPAHYPPQEGEAGLAFGNSENVYFKGMLDDIMIYNRALTPAEILRVYIDQGGSASKDTTPPVISSVNSTNITNASASVTWTTNENSTTQVEYGPTTSYGTQTAIDINQLTSHSVNLTNLATNTTYHFRARSKDASGNEAISQDYTFTTLSTYKPEDINQDGTVNTQDLQAAANQILGTQSWPRADVNSDGKFDVKDLQRIANVILGV